MDEFAMANVLPGKLNALVKNIMGQIGTNDPNEAVQLVNSGRRVVVEPIKLNPCWIRVSDTVLAVNLAASPSFLLKSIEEGLQIGQGGALLERRPDGLYMSGRKLVLCHSRAGVCELQDEQRTGVPIFNVNVLEALYHNPNVIPENWKTDQQYNIFFPLLWWIAQSEDRGWKEWMDAEIRVTKATRERFDQEDGGGGPTYIYGWDERQDVPNFKHVVWEAWKSKLGLVVFWTIEHRPELLEQLQYVVEVKLHGRDEKKITIHQAPEGGWKDFVLFYGDCLRKQYEKR